MGVKIQNMDGEMVECVPIRARGNTTKNKPTYECGNCKCKRYNPCGCAKKARK